MGLFLGISCWMNNAPTQSQSKIQGQGHAAGFDDPARFMTKNPAPPPPKKKQRGSHPGSEFSAFQQRQFASLAFSIAGEQGFSKFTHGSWRLKDVEGCWRYLRCNRFEVTKKPSMVFLVDTNNSMFSTKTQSLRCFQILSVLLSLWAMFPGL